MMNGLFGLNGILGNLIVVVVLLVAVVFFGLKAVHIQQEESTHYYKLDTKSLQMFGNKHGFYQIHKE